MKAAVDTERKSHKFIGKIENGSAPCLVVLGAVHGNEPAGVKALERVFKHLREEDIAINGSFYGLIGNKRAYEAGQRYLDTDLNRVWDFEMHRLNGEHNQELKERDEIFKLLQSKASETNQLYVMDLHTTSSSSSPFFIMGDTIRNRNFARELPVPKVLGVEEQINGTMSAYLNTRGVVAINFEAGNHVDPKSIDRHEAAIWVALVSSGCLNENQVPAFSKKIKLLKKSASRLPLVFESVFRYGISKNERYVMKPGYYNFRRVKKGEQLAYSNGSPVFAPHTGRIFMPLYQEQGSDGFFIIRRIHPFWLVLSRKMRKLGPEKWISRLPGITRDPDDSHTVQANKKIARFYPLQVFHLFGYRKFLEKDGVLYMTRRRYDMKAPDQIDL